jgi:hypothetical protein
VIKTIFFILVPIQVSPPSHSASEQVTKSKGALENGRLSPT